MEKLRTKNTITRFRRLSGETDAEICLSYCAAALRIVHASQRDKTINPDEDATLSDLAANLAFYRYNITQNVENSSSFKAGDITIKSNTSGQIKNATLLLEIALAAAKPMLKNSIVLKSF